MQSTEAIILKKRPHSEADEILSVLTKEHGKLQLRARGIKKNGAKLAGSLQLLNRLEIYFVVGRGWPIVTDGTGRESFPAIKKSAAKLRAAAIVGALIDRLLPDSSADPLLWEQLLEYLETLERAGESESRFALAPVLFVYQMLNRHGFRPTLEQCAVCGRTVKNSEKLSFSVSAGGIIDERCLGIDPAAPPVSAEIRRLLEHWQTAPLGKILADPKSFSRRRELTRIVERFGEWHLGFQLGL